MRHLKLWILSLVLAVAGALFGINRLKKRQRRDEIRVTSLRVQAAQKKAEELATVDAAQRIEVAEARRNLEVHAAYADTKLDTLYSRIDDRETRMMNLQAKIDKLKERGR